uniref:GIY-YIG domain-containing protein n=1 Tax=viral metagenome TaxID=1070528 RepID=A0A6C0DPM9_9ZZZZ
MHHSDDIECVPMQSWYVYCLATYNAPICTYIGATVDRDRRLRQHNGELKGGAKKTSMRKGDWYRVCSVSGFTDSHKALSFEWHWKQFSRKLQGTPLEKREKGLKICLEWASKLWPELVLEVV